MVPLLPFTQRSLFLGLSNHKQVRRTPSLTSISSTAQAAIGSVTGSEAWKASGEQAKAHGVADMKAASEGRDASNQGYGKAEELAGKAVGCEGMVKEGDASAKKE